MSRRWSIKFEPRDVWVGLFWDRRKSGVWLYICLVPCVVIIGEPVPVATIPAMCEAVGCSRVANGHAAIDGRVVWVCGTVCLDSLAQVQS